MNYSLNRIWTVSTSYIKRNIIKYDNSKSTFTIVDITNSRIGRIEDSTLEQNIESILWNDFCDPGYVNNGLAKIFKEDRNQIITRFRVPVKNFNLWYTIQNGKIIIDTLDNMCDDWIIFPVRNWKRKYGKIVDIKYIDIDEKSPSTICFIDEFGGEIYYPAYGSTTKTLLVGEKYQLFLSCSAYAQSIEFVNELKKYLIDNPSYLILLDSGRYSHFQVGDVNKRKYISTGLVDYNDMFVFGEIK